jgi:hypothetical protein
MLKRKSVLILGFLSILVIFNYGCSVGSSNNTSVNTQNSSNSAANMQQNVATETLPLLFAEKQAPNTSEASSQTAASSPASLPVEVNRAILNSLAPNAEITFKVKGQTHQAQIKEVTPLFDNAKLWSGFTTDGGEFSIIGNSNLISGKFQIPGVGFYKLTQSNENEFLLDEIQPDKVRKCRIERPERSGVPRSSPAFPTYDGPTYGVRILVLYTPRVRLKSNRGVENGSREKIESDISQMCSETDGAFRRSRTRARIDACIRREIQYAEDPEAAMATILNSLQKTNDGVMDEIHQWRNEAAADIVIILVDNNDEGGRANRMTEDEMNASFAAKAFGVVDWYSGMAGGLFSHEVGHIYGCGHDFEHDPVNPGMFAYSAGYHFTRLNSRSETLRGRTIMAYESFSDEVLTLHYSNPDVLYGYENVVALGDSTHNNAATINISAQTVAGFK